MQPYYYVNEALFSRPYSRQTAAYPMPWLLEKKFWPTVSRIDDGNVVHSFHFHMADFIQTPAYGDLNLMVSDLTHNVFASEFLPSVIALPSRKLLHLHHKPKDIISV
jgi:hypothetical protein